MQKEQDILAKFRDKGRNFWDSLPSHLKLFNFLILVMSLFAFISGSQILALSPQKVMGQWPPKIWTIATYGVMDMYLFPFLLHLVMINYALYELRQIWKPVNFFIFILFASSLAAIFYSFAIFLIYSLSGGYICTQFYSKSFVTLQTTTLFLLMALRQHFSDRLYNTRIPFGDSTFKIPYKHLVHAQMLITLVEIIVLQISFAYFFISLCSYYSSWICLRYIIKHELSRSKGDPSSQFALVQVLPYQLKPYLEKFCDDCFALGVKSGLLRDFNRRCQSGVLGESNEIERKRALERLNAEVEKIVQSEQEKKPEEEIDEEVKPLKTGEGEDDEFGQFESVELEEQEEGTK